MVSDRKLTTLTAPLLASLLASGCSGLPPAERQVTDMGDVAAADEYPRAAVAPFVDAPLPKQAYGSNGEKLAYVPQPNPYATETANVPAKARAAFVSASGLLQKDNLKGARTQFLKLTEGFPSLSGPWLMLGVIAEKNDKYDEAIGHYRKAVSVNRNNVNAYIALGLAQRRHGDFGGAKATYVEALKVWRDFPEAHLNLAILYDLYLNQPEQAQKHYEAYYFLTGKKDEKVHKWLVEVKRRTGIERSFIDTPPKSIAAVPVEKAGDAGVAVDHEVQLSRSSAAHEEQ